jgi:NADH dehydrogenase [ubiquinone] 1 alpha subcomplex assembly factor 5
MLTFNGVNCWIAGTIEKLIVMDASYEMVQACKNAVHQSFHHNVDTVFLVGDEEFLPIKERSVHFIHNYLQIYNYCYEYYNFAF